MQKLANKRWDPEINRDELAEFVRKTPKPGTTPGQELSTIDKIRKVVETKTASRVNGILVDMFSASMIIQVYDALSPENQVKFAARKVVDMASLAFRIVDKVSK